MDIHRHSWTFRGHFPDIAGHFPSADGRAAHGRRAPNTAPRAQRRARQKKRETLAFVSVGASEPARARLRRLRDPLCAAYARFDSQIQTAAGSANARAASRPNSSHRMYIEHFKNKFKTPRNQCRRLFPLACGGGAGEARGGGESKLRSMPPPEAQRPSAGEGPTSPARAGEEKRYSAAARARLARRGSARASTRWM
jgi:hypothetical protein